MLSAQKSAKSDTNFGLNDIDNILSPRPAKKEPSKSLSFQVPQAVTIKMAKEAIYPNFDRSAWDLASWKQTLIKLGVDEELEPAVEKAAEGGTTGAKEVGGGAGGGDTTGGDAATVGNEGC
ncbi:hypothetical protein Hanom_Chr05g00426761 [Helianthus anomalus]